MAHPKTNVASRKTDTLRTFPGPFELQKGDFLRDDRVAIQSKRSTSLRGEEGEMGEEEEKEEKRKEISYN